MAWNKIQRYVQCRLLLLFFLRQPHSHACSYFFADFPGRHFGRGDRDLIHEWAQQFRRGESLFESPADLRFIALPTVNGSAKRRKPFLGIDSVYRADAYHWFRGVQERLMDNEARNTSGRDMTTGIAPVIPTAALNITRFKPDYYMGSNVRKKTVGKVKSKIFETEYIEVVWK